MTTEVRSVSESHGLAYDLDLAISKQTVFRPSSGGGPSHDEPPIPMDDRASEVAGELRRVLDRWAGVIHRQHYVIRRLGPTCDRCVHRSCDEIRGRSEKLPTALVGIASWLHPRLRLLATHPEAGKAHSEIVGAVRVARRAVDRPADRHYAGP